MHGLFVTGTDTNVGKTIACAALLLRYPGTRYWKPIQTGIEQDDDTAEVSRLTGSETLNTGVRLPNPVSPHLAARLANQTIDIHQLATLAQGSRWIVEGAGGALVPLNDHALTVDFIRLLQLPALIVARSTLGTINHTLLTLEALRSRAIPVAGVLLSGPANPSNREAIETYGRIPVLELPHFASLSELVTWTPTHFDPNAHLEPFLT